MSKPRAVTAWVATLVVFGGVAGALAQPGHPPGGHGPPPPGGPAAERRADAAERREAAAERREAAAERREAAAERREGDGRGPGPLGSGDRPGPGPGAHGSGAPLGPPPFGSGARGHGPGHPRGPVSRALAEKRREQMKARWEAARQSRPERVKARREAIRARWGAAVDQPAMANELRIHAWRIARLEAIKAMASDEGNTEAVARCDRLIERENARHERRMEALRAAPGATGSAAASGAPATPTPAAS